MKWLRLLLKIDKLIPLTAALLILIAAFFFLSFKNIFPNFSLVTRQEKGGFLSLLAEKREISRLTTLRYIRRSVFPHDFYDPQVDWELLLNRRKWQRPEKEMQLLSTKEQEHLKLWELCQKIGLDLEDDSCFLVISSEINIGLDLTSQNPKTKILDFKVRDFGSKDYPYPEVEITPEQWKKIIQFVKTPLLRQAEKAGILKKAKKSWKKWQNN